MGNVLKFRTTIEKLSIETIIEHRQRCLFQTRVVVPAEEFAGYRWQKSKYGSVGGSKAHLQKNIKRGTL